MYDSDGINQDLFVDCFFDSLVRTLQISDAHIPDLLIRVIDRNKIVRYVNKNFLEILKCENTDNPTGKYCWEVFQSNACNTSSCRLLKASTTCSYFSMPCDEYAVTGSHTGQILHTIPLFFHDDRFVGILELSQLDRAKQRLVQKTGDLNLMLNTLRKASELCDAGVIVVNISNDFDHGQIADLSPIVAEKLHYSCEELIGTNVFDYVLSEGDDLLEFRRSILLGLSTSQVERIILADKDKTTVHAEFVVVTMDWKEKQYALVYLHFLDSTSHHDADQASQNSMHDYLSKVAPDIEYNLKESISRHRAIEEQLFTLYDQQRKDKLALEKQINDYTLFIRVLAHELKSPLTSVVGSSEVLKDALKEKPMLARIASNINKGALNLNRRITDLIDVAKGEYSMLSISPVDVSVEEMITEAVEIVEHDLTEKNILLSVNVDPSCDVIYVDPSRMQQILLNLLNNSIKCTDAGGFIKITARRIDDNLSLSVSDNGCGIKKEILPNVFDLYKTRDSSMPLSGLGLGLPLVKKLVELHKGQISIESKEGIGTTIFISIPYKKIKRSNRCVDAGARNRR